MRAESLGLDSKLTCLCYLDHATDEAIQRVLRDDLDGVTMITISHRLRGVMSADRVLVLDQGEVLEYDTPLKLMADESGSFADLVARSGEQAVLKRLAEEAEERRRVKKST